MWKILLAGKHFEQHILKTLRAQVCGVHKRSVVPAQALLWNYSFMSRCVLKTGLRSDQWQQICVCSKQAISWGIGRDLAEYLASNKIEPCNLVIMILVIWFAKASEQRSARAPVSHISTYSWQLWLSRMKLSHRCQSRSPRAKAWPRFGWQTPSAKVAARLAATNQGRRALQIKPSRMTAMTTQLTTSIATCEPSSWTMAITWIAIGV